MTIYQSVTALLVKSKFEEIFSYIETYIEEEDDRAFLITIQNNYYSLEKENNTGSIEYNKYLTEKNKLLIRLIKLVRSLDKHIANKLTSKVTLKEHSNIKLLKSLLEFLDESFSGFKAQAEWRDKLRGTVSQRMGINNIDSHETFFIEHYKNMDDFERDILSEIREYTEDVINVYNRKALAIVMSRPEIYEEIPRLAELERHLLVWLGKYESIFKRTTEMGLVYTVEENVTFPNGIEEDIRKYINGKTS